MMRLLLSLLVATLLSPTLRGASSITATIDFEELPLGTQDFYNGSDGAGGFESLGSWFNNFNSGYWMGWSYSQTTDTTTAGPSNQYSAFTGAGFDGSTKYGVAYNGLDSGSGILPEITLPAGAEPQGVQVTNTTYAALSMLQGDQFAKQFGGLSGNDPDYFLLTVEGRNAAETVLGTVDLYLADYRFADPSQDYILDEWTELDLTSLAGLGVEKLVFRLESSDNSIFGMNTPAYLAIDNLDLELAATPGDFDISGNVDAADLAIWETNYGNTVAVTFSDGDANENGFVDGKDFLLWQQNSAPSTMQALALPEPSCLILTVSFVALFHLNQRLLLPRHL